MGEDPKAVSAADKAAVAVGQEITRLVVGLVLEGQRALVIAGAARLDLALENVLKHSMRHHPGGSDNLFDPDRPLGSFAAKIALCHRLGLVSDEVEHALQLVRRIRNEFAHSVGTAGLSESSHSNRLRELERLCGSVQWFATVHTHVLAASQGRPEISVQVAVFSGALATLIGAIEAAAYFDAPFAPVHPASFAIWSTLSNPPAPAV